MTYFVFGLEALLNMTGLSSPEPEAMTINGARVLELLQKIRMATSRC
ncbi:MAG: hypothetical protein Q8K59_02280 [Nitrosomonas sp.]|nr:hypothetical protein [Nitrosomonas sp.]MDP1949919.1 hypothetical protein [Nitrosomonas sp.]